MKQTWYRLTRNPMVRWGLPTLTFVISVFLPLFGLSYFGVLYTFAPVAVLWLLTGLVCDLRSLVIVVVLATVTVFSGGPHWVVPTVQWSRETEQVPMLYYHDLADQGPTTLRDRFLVDEAVDRDDGELEQVIQLAGWVNSRWTHSGSNMPSASDPLTILAEAAEGQSFRCVEYAIVMSGAAQALGWPARVVNLKTKRVATAYTAAGHVVTEVWLHTWKKWAMVDAQLGYLFLQDGVPLHAVELRQALAERPGSVDIVSADGTVGWLSKTLYTLFLGPYLYHFDTRFDQRVFLPGNERMGGNIMLLPDGAPRPDKFQRRWPLSIERYTSTVDVFYAEPDLP